LKNTILHSVRLIDPFFKQKDKIPADQRKDVTYGRIVCTYQSKKKAPNCTRITMEGNLVSYPDDFGTPTVDLLTVKLLFNSIISTDNAKFMTIDIKDFYLMTPMKRYEYFCIKINLFPQDIINGYNLHDNMDANRNMFCQVRHGMYGLPQAGIIAQELLKEGLIVAGYQQFKLTPGYLTHDWQPISFTLVVDDFGVEYINKDDVTHLLDVLQKECKDVTYGGIVCTYQSKKKAPNCTRITMGGNLVNYPDDCGTPTADLLTIKLLFNSIISTDNAKFMTIDIKDFYLMTPMKRYEYFHVKINLFPQDINNEYNLHDIVDANRNIFCEVCHGMYGLSQSRIISQELLKERLIIAGY
jgi:hypothetical protein